MFLSILAAAAVFTTPSADVHVAMEVNEKLPAWVSRQHNWTAAELEVFADPTGRVLTCKVRRFVPLQDVADEMCKVLIGRQVVPAKNFDDEESYGLGLMIVVVDEDGKSDLASRLGDLQQDGIVLTVGSLPESFRETPETRVPLNLEIGTGGEVLRCDGSKDVPEAFREVACNHASAKSFDVRIGANGGAVPYVRNFDIVFEPGPYVDGRGGGPAPHSHGQG